MPSPQRFFVGVHFHRHFGGPGHLTVTAEGLELTTRKQTRSVVQRLADDAVVHIERKRWEPPGTNHWLRVSDGATTAHATMGRRRAAEIAAAASAVGFTVDRVPPPRR